jgi:hypothetical protein
MDGGVGDRRVSDDDMQAVALKQKNQRGDGSMVLRNANIPKGKPGRSLSPSWISVCEWRVSSHATQHFWWASLRTESRLRLWWVYARLYA